MPSDSVSWGDRLDVRYFLLERLRGLHGLTVVEVGCNRGEVLRAVPADNRRIGFDLDEAGLEVARREDPGARYFKADLFDVPVQGADVVLLPNIVEMFSPTDRPKVVDAVAAMLKPGGRLFLTTPNNARYHTCKATAEEVTALLAPYFSFKLRGYNPFP